MLERKDRERYLCLFLCLNLNLNLLRHRPWFGASFLFHAECSDYLVVVSIACGGFCSASESLERDEIQGGNSARDTLLERTGNARSLISWHKKSPGCSPLHFEVLREVIDSTAICTISTISAKGNLLEFAQSFAGAGEETHAFLSPSMRCLVRFTRRS